MSELSEGAKPIDLYTHAFLVRWSGEILAGKTAGLDLLITRLGKAAPLAAWWEPPAPYDWSDVMIWARRVSAFSLAREVRIRVERGWRDYHFRSATELMSILIERLGVEPWLR